MKHLLTVLALVMSNVVFPQAECPNTYDGNGDGAVTISDLLDLLGLFGDADADQDGVWDSVDACVDTESCNYAANPTEPCAYIDVLGICGGGCVGDGDGDGICDDVDTCVGIEDECGVCNGPGPTEIVIDQIITTYDSIFLPVVGEWIVYAVEVDTTFTYTCAPSFSVCGDPVSYQGYDYATVLIGDQCWFAENLRSELYRNNDSIQSSLTGSEWGATTSGAVSVYGNGNSGCQTFTPDGNACDQSWSLNEYGRVYNWWAVADSRGLCPSGWHVPSQAEWTTLVEFLGDAYLVGDDMKSDFGWYDDNNGTNSSGFSGLPGGYRFWNSDFRNAGKFGFWWSSTVVPWDQDEYTQGNACYLRLSSSTNDAQISSAGTTFGLSVRCVRDSE